MTDRWFDDAAGPVVRPYAMTRGGTHAGTEAARLDLIALVIAREPEDEDAAAYEEALEDHSLAPEHLEIVRVCRREPQSVAELAADLDLPVGVVRVFVGDLLDSGLVRVTRPVPPAELPDES